jgi:hypothetical protein
MMWIVILLVVAWILRVLLPCLVGTGLRLHLVIQRLWGKPWLWRERGRVQEGDLVKMMDGFF